MLRCIQLAFSRSSKAAFALCQIRRIGTPFLQSRLYESGDLELHHDFISQYEHDTLLKAIEPMIHNRTYERGHWDQVIVGFREVSKPVAAFPQSVQPALMRPERFFDPGSQILPVHILDLEQDGYILPHVDSVKFSGPTLCGLSLLSESVMHFHLVGEEDTFVEVVLPPRSIYVMRRAARYDWSHAIPAGDVTTLDGRVIHRQRRISLLFRDAVRDPPELILASGVLEEVDDAEYEDRTPTLADQIYQKPRK